MPRHITFAFPGQGSQHLGMLDKFKPEEFDIVKEEIDKALGFKIFDIVSGTVDRYIYSDVSANDLINKTHITQPAILLASYLDYSSITQKLNIKPDLVCGHSLGEYSSLVAAESINIYDALSLVSKRGELMDKSPKGSMYAILNTDIDLITECCERASFEIGKISSIANINSQNQIVISGDLESVELTINYLKEKGAKKCIKLNVSVASHCNLMTEAAERFREVLNKTNFLDPKINFINNYDSKISKNIIEIKDNLFNQLTSPVQWINIMKFVKEQNGIFIECGPKKVLSGLAKANDIDNIYSTSSENFIDEIKKVL